MAKDDRKKAKQKAQKMLASGKSVERVAAKTGIKPQRVERIASKPSKPSKESKETKSAVTKPQTPSYTGTLAQYAAPGGFGAGAVLRAREAGLTDTDIKSGVEELRKQGMSIGQRVDTALNPQIYGGDLAKQGAAEGGFSDAGSGQKYEMRSVFLPQGSTVGGGKGVVWAAGPMTDQQIINALTNKPRDTWVLPENTASAGQPYTPPAGWSYINPTSSSAEQARQAVAGLDIPRMAAVTPAGPREIKEDVSSSVQTKTKPKTFFKYVKNFGQDQEAKTSKKFLQNWIESFSKTKKDK